MDSKIPQIDIPRLQMREILAGRWRCCWNCDNWSHKHEVCDKYKEKPPTEVIIVGCCEWFASGIPF
jgi:hypothetical protein